jgi:hypothetical protein
VKTLPAQAQVVELLPHKPASTSFILGRSDLSWFLFSTVDDTQMICGGLATSVMRLLRASQRGKDKSLESKFFT